MFTLMPIKNVQKNSQRLFPGTTA